VSSPDSCVHVATMRSSEILLEGILDYAGLFPPAELEMSQAVARYRDYRVGPDSWMLGRFICPVSRLTEFERNAQAYLDYDLDTPPWKVSALAGPELEADLERINDFNRRHTLDSDEGRVFIDTIEVKASSAPEIERLMQRMHPTLTVYVEIPLADNLEELIAGIAREGVRAKIRAGGLTPDAFPTSQDLARFLSLCAKARVPFKATAGLHHPIRAVHRLTYEPDSPFGVMHGFLNLFLASAYLSFGMGEEEAAELLEETAGKDLQFDETGVSWRGQRLSNEQLASSRRISGISFGSCSFAEPLEGLRALGLR
jgi:hypothetical protein